MEFAWLPTLPTAAFDALGDGLLYPCLMEKAQAFQQATQTTIHGDAVSGDAVSDPEEAHQPNLNDASSGW